MDSKESKNKIGFTYAIQGITYVWKHERNFRLHILALFLVIAAGFILQVSALEWIFICLVSGLVLVTEMINSALELMIDYLKPDIHPSAKAIKDIAAGSVLISALLAIVVGSIIFIPKVIDVL